MTPNDLPPELLELERALVSRAQIEPPAELRSHVLMMVGREWPSLRSAPLRGRFIRFAVAAAAAALLAINLSASLANDTDWLVAAPAQGADLAAVAAHLHTLDPDLSDHDALGQAILLHAAAGLTPAPGPAPSTERIISYTELSRWDTR